MATLRAGSNAAIASQGGFFLFMTASDILIILVKPMTLPALMLLLKRNGWCFRCVILGNYVWNYNLEKLWKYFSEIGFQINLSILFADFTQQPIVKKKTLYIINDLPTLGHTTSQWSQCIIPQQAENDCTFLWQMLLATESLRQWDCKILCNESESALLNAP